MTQETVKYLGRRFKALSRISTILGEFFSIAFSNGQTPFVSFSNIAK
jgi:hypothetical protein